MDRIKIDESLMLELLSKANVCEAQKILERNFSKLDRFEKNSLLASLDPKSYKEVYEQLYIRDSQFWVLKNTLETKYIGLCGLYEEKDDLKVNCWLGWFCVDPLYRGLGIGKKMLKIMIHEAKQRQKQKMYIMTYQSKEFEVAINLYNSFGFQRKIQKKVTSKKQIIFEKEIK